MISRYEVTLNGISLSTLSANILILDVSYSEPSFNDNSYRVAKRNGARTDDRVFNPKSVSISFEIHAYDIRQRTAIKNAVEAWAKNGGRLEINDHEGQYMRCVCSKFPTIESVRNWTDPLTIQFTANDIPFWQENMPSSITLTAGTSGSGTFFVPGSVNGALVEANIHTNAAITSVALTVNGRTLTLSNITVSSGKDIKITYDDKAIQSIKVGTTSLLGNRTGVTDLLANCGENNTVSFTSDASVTVTFSVRGCWM